jgi:hypothetical protein
MICQQDGDDQVLRPKIPAQLTDAQFKSRLEYPSGDNENHGHKQKSGSSFLILWRAVLSHD